MTLDSLACGLVADWQRGSIDADEVSRGLLEATDGDVETVRAAMASAVEWWAAVVATARSSRRDPFPWEPHLSREARDARSR